MEVKGGLSLTKGTKVEGKDELGDIEDENTEEKGNSASLKITL